jgi:protein-disulfide isomerase
MRLSILDVASLGLLACALTLTGVVVKRDLISSRPRNAVTKVRPRADVQLVGRSIGSPEANVPVVVFADFQCPYCARAQAVIKQTLAEYSGEVKIMYRHLPIETIHPHAWTAALAAECAGDQGAFHAYHDLLYAHQDSIGKISWSDLAVRAAVPSQEQFESCLREERHTGAIERDVLLARELKINGTPTFIVADEAYSGLPPSSWFRQQIARAQATRR